MRSSMGLSGHILCGPHCLNPSSQVGLTVTMSDGSQANAELVVPFNSLPTGGFTATRAAVTKCVMRAVVFWRSVM